MMTDQEDDELLDETPEESEADAELEVEEAESEVTAEEDDGEESEEGEKEGEGEPDPKDQQIEALKTQVQQMNGRVGSERGKATLLAKVIKSLEQTEGAVNRDEIAKAIGLDRPRLDSILDAEVVDDDKAFNERCNTAEKGIKAVKAVLKSSGKDAEEIIQTYGVLLNVSQEERDRFMNLPEDDLVAHIIEATSAKGGKVKRLRESKGDVLAALSSSEEQIAELEAEIAALKGGKKPGQSKNQQRVPLNGNARAASAPKGGSAIGETFSKVLG